MGKLELFFYRQKKKRLIKKRKRVSRSIAGDIALFLLLLLFGAFSAYPLVYTICAAFKPLNELFIYPPKLFFQHPTLDNFTDLSILLEDSWVPFSRYLFNTIFITFAGTVGHVLIASMAAYPLAKHKFPGSKIIFGLVVYSLMFAAQVTATPRYMVFSCLGLIDTPLAIIVPAFAYSLGLYLMKQFMSDIPMELIESAKIDGANEFQIYWRVVMPLVKPAWLTLIILLFQQLWNNDGGTFIYSESIKPLSYALHQIVAGGIARTGTSSAVMLIMMSVPILVFILSQSQIIETMAHSGMK
ncbi:MAG: carbohydrate ABC transporter permease [Bacilli bacterium]|nr:carbohydrate ABC transporter permease [Mollicutes bacterium]MDY3899086.1 carbohydrate ABC transporter permease [Bacilli bacterium]